MSKVYKPYKQVSELYQCILKNTAMQAIMEQMRSFVFYSQFLSICEKNNFFGTNPLAETQHSVGQDNHDQIQNELQYLLLKNWQDVKKSEKLNVASRNSKLSKIFKENLADGLKVDELLTYCENCLKTKFGLGGAGNCIKDIDLIYEFIELISGHQRQAVHREDLGKENLGAIDRVIGGMKAKPSESPRYRIHGNKHSGSAVSMETMKIRNTAALISPPNPHQTSSSLNFRKKLLKDLTTRCGQPGSRQPQFRSPVTTSFDFKPDPTSAGLDSGLRVDSIKMKSEGQESSLKPSGLVKDSEPSFGIKDGGFKMQEASFGGIVDSFGAKGTGAVGEDSDKFLKLSEAGNSRRVINGYAGLTQEDRSPSSNPRSSNPCSILNQNSKNLNQKSESLSKRRMYRMLRRNRTYNENFRQTGGNSNPQKAGLPLQKDYTRTTNTTTTGLYRAVSLTTSLKASSTAKTTLKASQQNPPSTSILNSKTSSQPQEKPQESQIRGKVFINPQNNKIEFVNSKERKTQKEDIEPKSKATSQTKQSARAKVSAFNPHKLPKNHKNSFNRILTNMYMMSFDTESDHFGASGVAISKVSCDFVEEIKVQNVNRDFLEEASVQKVFRVSDSEYLLILQNSSACYYDLKNSNKVLKPHRLCQERILDVELDHKRNLWVSSVKALYVYDQKFRFVTEMCKSHLNKETLRKRPKTLNISRDKKYIYWLKSNSIIQKFSTLNRFTAATLKRETVGQDIASFKIISKKFMITLSSSLSYFMLSNYKEKKKKAGYKVRDHRRDKPAAVMSYDVTKKGSRMIFGSVNSVGESSLTVLKISQSEFTEKYVYTNLDSIGNVRFVEGFFRPQDHPYVLVSTNKAVHLFGLSKYQLIHLDAVDNIASGMNIELYFQKGMMVFTSDDQSVNWFSLEQVKERRRVSQPKEIGIEGAGSAGEERTRSSQALRSRKQGLGAPRHQKQASLNQGSSSRISVRDGESIQWKLLKQRARSKEAWNRYKSLYH